MPRVRALPRRLVLQTLHISYCFSVRARFFTADSYVYVQAVIAHVSQDHRDDSIDIVCWCIFQIETQHETRREHSTTKVSASHFATTTAAAFFFVGAVLCLSSVLLCAHCCIFADLDKATITSHIDNLCKSTRCRYGVS